MCIRFLIKTGTSHLKFVMLCKEKIIFGVKLFLEQVLKKKDKSCPFSWWDIFTLPSIFKAGKSSPPGCRKQKCSCDKPETTSSIRLYIYVSQLFTQTLRCENRAADRQSLHADARLPPTHRTLSICVCLCRCLYLCCLSAVAAFQLCELCPVLQSDLTCPCPHMCCLI